MGRLVTRLRLERAEHVEVKGAREGQSRVRKRREEVGRGLAEPGAPRAEDLAWVPSLRTLGPPPH